MEINCTRIVRAVVHNRDSAGIDIGIAVGKQGIAEIAARPAVKCCNSVVFNLFLNCFNVQILNGYLFARIAAEEYTELVRGIALGDGKIGGYRGPFRTDIALICFAIHYFFRAAGAVKAVTAHNIIRL